MPDIHISIHMANIIIINIIINISVPKRQNPAPLYLVKLRYRALKFLVHFSSVLLFKVPQRQFKVVTH